MWSRFFLQTGGSSALCSTWGPRGPKKKSTFGSIKPMTYENICRCPMNNMISQRRLWLFKFLTFVRTDPLWRRTWSSYWVWITEPPLLQSQLTKTCSSNHFTIIAPRSHCCVCERGRMFDFFGIPLSFLSMTRLKGWVRHQGRGRSLMQASLVTSLIRQ